MAPAPPVTTAVPISDAMMTVVGCAPRCSATTEKSTWAVLQATDRAREILVRWDAIRRLALP